MNTIKLIVQGFIIGIGKIIPGVSGAMFAMMFGVYEKALDIICHLKTKFLKNFGFIMPLGISILIAIIFGSNIIKRCLDNYYLPTMLFFVGMMAAGIKPLFENVKNEKFSIKNLIFAIIISVLLIIIESLDFGSNEGIIKRDLFTIIMLFISGFLDAVATIVPGICGTALLMIVGYYDIVISSLGDLLNISNISHNLFVLIPFTIGLIIGALIVAKIINYLFKHYKTKTYYTIIGFAIMSTIILFIKAITSTFVINELIVGIILFIIGFIIVHFLEKIKL